MIELELTENIQKYLAVPTERRSLQEGADLLLRVSRNKILYRNIMRNPAKGMRLVDYHLGRILKQRLIDITHEQVQQMMTKVDAIAADRGMARESIELRRGKRADHDELPSEVQQLYADNADIMRRMREAHTRLRLINSTNSTCPDSDRYPLAKMIIELDSQYRTNWNLYDHYKKGTPLAATEIAVDARTASKNAAKTINLVIGKYAANPTVAQADRIRELYSQIANPSEKLRSKMSELNLL